MRKAAQEYINTIEQLDLSLEYQCVNALQRTPWQINSFVVDVLRTCWDSGQEWVGLPPRDNLDLPKYPFSKEPKYLNEEEIIEFNTFKSVRKKVHTINNKSMSRRIQVERTIQIAEEYKSIGKMWYVWQLDFRGRKYPVESFLSPQNLSLIHI